MKAFVFLLLLSLNLGCVAYVERDTHSSSRYCEVEYVKTSYYGEQEWHRDVVPCTRVAGYQRRHSTVYFFPFHGLFRLRHNYHRRITRPRKHTKRRHHHHPPRLIKSKRHVR